MTLVLTAHGSADPRSAATARSVVDCIRRLRPGLDVRVAFCEQNSPNLRDVLAALTPGDAVVVPLLLADAYHARVDIPAMIAESGADVRQADVLGEDDRLVHVLRQRLEHAGVSRLDPDVGVLVTAVGSSRPQANARTATVARELTLTTRWTAHDRVRHRPAAHAGRGGRPTARPRRHPTGHRAVVPGATAASPTAWRNSHAHNAFRCRHRWARIGWWPRRCWTASTPPWPPGAPRSDAGRSETVADATGAATWASLGSDGTRVART